MLYRLPTVIALFCGLTCAGPAHAVAISGQGSWQTTLLPRYFDSDSKVDAYYDVILDITWDDEVFDGLTYETATDFVALSSILGLGWRLPTAGVAGNCTFLQNAGTDCGFNVRTNNGGGGPATEVYSELATMFYQHLGNKAAVNAQGAPQSGFGLTNTGPFEAPPLVDLAAVAIPFWGNPFTSAFSRNFSFFNGGQTISHNSNEFAVWLVADGDIGALQPVPDVPLPATVWLLGSALLGLGCRLLPAGGHR